MLQLLIVAQRAQGNMLELSPQQLMLEGSCTVEEVVEEKKDQKDEKLPPMIQVGESIDNFNF